MPALDRCHYQIVRALDQDGWHVEHAPYRVVVAARTAYIDLEVAKTSRSVDPARLLLELKCFAEPDAMTREIYEAIGQYLIYRAMLDVTRDPRPLFLTLPDEVFNKRFDPVVIKVLEEQDIRLLLVDLNEERIIRWIE